MLNKNILRVAVAATALTFSASASFAEQYRIMMMGEAFFPEITYLNSGDEVIFMNLSGETRDITAEDESWTVTALADGAEASLTVIDSMSIRYTTATAEGEVEGRMDFGGPTETPPSE